MQFVVSTDQVIGAPLALYLCDPDGEFIAPIHAGPPLAFETDSNFKIKNTSAGDVNAILGILISGKQDEA